MKFTKADLKPGMIVTFRVNIKAIYVGVNKGNCMGFMWINLVDYKYVPFDEMTDTMEYNLSNHYDIMCIESYDGSVIWERYECPFKHGEIVEVSDNGEYWFLKRFCKYDERSEYKYRTFDSSAMDENTGWKYCRKPE